MDWATKEKAYSQRHAYALVGIDPKVYRDHPSLRTASFRTSNGAWALRHRAQRPSPLHQPPRRAIIKPGLYKKLDRNKGSD